LDCTCSDQHIGASIVRLCEKKKKKKKKEETKKTNQPNAACLITDPAT